MSLALAIARIEEIRSAFEAPAAAPPAASTATAATAPVAAAATASSGGAFSNLLQGALGGAGATTYPTTAGLAPAGLTSSPGLTGGALAPGGGAAAMVQLAEGEVGQAEFPPGSNDSPRIATYRQATAGSGVGPWCAYFVSWLAQQAGTPLGDQGQGFGRVDDVYAWAQRTGRALPNGPGVVPRPGDLIVWDEHIGIVEGVLPDGSVQTIEGNSSDRVSRNTHPASSALGYVRMS